VIHCALTIAGSDPTGGAGIQADLKTFAALGVYGFSVITALTAQNASGVQGVHPVPPSFVEFQLKSLFEEFQISAIKIGMVYHPDTIRALARFIRQNGLRNLVLDPVMTASAGGDLLQKGGLDILKKDLIPLATLITPNLDEAGALVDFEVKDMDSMKDAAAQIHALGPAFVLIKGGHMKGRIHDLFFDGNNHVIIPVLRKPFNVRGTGCALSAAITAGLAKGLTISDAVFEAHAYIQRVIQAAFSIGNGPRYPDHFAL
jgi:hydroxymethylpyrimidine/phosphomethylpyrimidine kinase